MVRETDHISCTLSSSYFGTSFLNLSGLAKTFNLDGDWKTIIDFLCLEEKKSYLYRCTFRKKLDICYPVFF